MKHTNEAAMAAPVRELDANGQACSGLAFAKRAIAGSAYLAPSSRSGLDRKRDGADGGT